MKIGIAGVGGIGSNVAMTLVRSGIDTLHLVDFDRVEASNLNRQFYFADQIGQPKVEALAENLRRIRPDLRLTTAIARIEAANCHALFADCSLIVEGLDGRSDKKMLLEAFGGDRMILSANGIAGGDLAGIRTRQLGTCQIVGDFVTDCADAPLFAHKVTTVTNHMCALILRHRGMLHDPEHR